MACVKLKNVHEVLLPLFYVSTIFGLKPFRITRNSYETSVETLIFALIMLAAFSGIAIAVILVRDFSDANGLISNITDILEIYITNVNMFVVILASCVSRKQTVKVVNQLAKLDQEMKFLLTTGDLKESYLKTFKILVVVLAVVYTYLFCSCFLDSYLFWEKSLFFTVMMALAFVCPKLISTCAILQFATLAILIKQRFRMLNEKLVSITKSIGTHKQANQNNLYLENYDRRRNVLNPFFPKILLNEKCAELIDQIRLKHHELCDVARDLNAAYSVQILSISLQVFVTLLGSLFACFKDLIASTKRLPDEVMLPYTFNVVFMCLTQIAAIAIISSRTFEEAHKTGSILHKSVPVTVEKELEIEILYFSLQLLHQNVEFSACRMFNLDESLILSMIGVICTYLVIVIQFEFANIKT